MAPLTRKGNASQKAAERSQTDRQRYEKEQADYSQIGVIDSGNRYGYIRFDEDGALEYQETEGADFVRAIFHHWIRDELSKQENQGKVQDRHAGLLPGDRTCYSAFQNHWGKRRQDYAPIVFKFTSENRPDPGYVVNDLLFDGVLVIDYWLKPVRAFREFPLVLSSKYEGAFMEPAQRYNHEIKIHDFRARMPPVIQKAKQGSLSPLFGENILAARMRRFREKAGCITWAPKSESKSIRAFMAERLDPTTPDSTQNLPDLTKVELDNLRLLNKGSKPKAKGSKGENVDRVASDSEESDEDDDDEQEAAIQGEAAPFPSISDYDPNTPPVPVFGEGAIDYSLYPSRPLPEFRLQDPEDCRNHIPRDSFEDQYLTEALEVTCRDYARLIGIGPPLRSFPKESYRVQWEKFQKRIDDIWLGQKPPPYLVLLGKWTGGIRDWKSAGPATTCFPGSLDFVEYE